MRLLIIIFSLVAFSSPLLAQGSASCEKRYCKQITTCGEAYYRLSVCGDGSLDRDDDGIPCEDMCGKTLSLMKARITAQPFQTDDDMGAATVAPAQSKPVSATTVKAEAFSCGSKRVCRDMLSCEEARFHLTQCGVTSLDGDSDGVPCSGLCK